MITMDLKKKMEKFKSDRIETLKVQFYSIMGQLELQKNIVITDKELQIFENSLLTYETEEQVAGSILGVIRRYKLMLKEDTEQLTLKPAVCFSEEMLSEEQVTVEPYIFPVNKGDAGISIEKRTLTVESDILNNLSITDIITDSENVPTGSSQLSVHTDEQNVVDENRMQLTNTFNEDADITLLNREEIVPPVSATETDDNAAKFADDMVITNTLIHNTTYIDEHELNTTRENKSIFLIYSTIDDYNIGCEFTMKKGGKFPRYECRKCRSLCDKDKKSGVAMDSPAAVITAGDEIKEVKKAKHHTQCRVEFNGTALARSHKNAAVVHKSRYGGSSKQVYDTHTRILGVSSEKVTAFDVEQGFGTFEYASSALKKSNRRKSAISLPKVNVGELDAIDKSSTRIMKSTYNESADYFLIGQDESAGVIVLGSKFLIERFFRSKQNMSDGTFKMSPKGYKQTYMLWYIEEGMCQDEVLPRSKAMLAVTFILKGKSEATYKIAFEILENYRKEQNIPEPAFGEYITDDEPAVRNVLAVIYRGTKFSLCHFHHNQNIVKCLAEHRLTTFIRKCKTDEQLWFYGKIKLILVLPLLPVDDIIPAFKSLSQAILSFIALNFTNPYEIEQFKKYFETIEAIYFSNAEKINLTCKYRKHMRSTNLIESTHNVFNKSRIIPQHGTVSNFIEAMTTIDVQYRTSAIAFETKGASTFPKKKKRYAQQQSVIDECTTNLDNGKISIEEFLKKCSECMIHEKYFKLIEAATERLEKAQDCGEDQYEVDEHIMAIFASSESSHGRVRTLCSKYFGDEWLN